MLRNFSFSLMLGLSALGLTNDLNAGWGSWGGSYGSYGSAGSYASYGSGGGSYGSVGGSYGSGGGSVGSGGSQGSWGGYASTGGSWGSTGGSYGSWGGRAHYGLFARWHARKAARAAYRHANYASGGSWGGSYGGTYGSQGSWGGSYGSYGSAGYASHGGSTGSWSYSEPAVSDCGGCGGCDNCSGSVIEGTIVPDATMESQPIDAVPSEARRSVRKGVLTVSVPEDAKIEVNGLPTTSTGEQRRYVSHGLTPGESYRYVVKAITERDGQTVEQTKVAMLHAGRVTSLDFDFNGENVVETSLTLNVPEDAKVYLSGNETRATGNQRRFSTTRIDEGQKWADYLVRVTVERDGRTLSKEQRVTLAGGDQAELDFAFNPTELADAR